MRELDAVGAVLSSSIYLTTWLYSKRKETAAPPSIHYPFFFLSMGHTELRVEIIVGALLVMCFETERFCADQLKKC